MSAWTARKYVDLPRIVRMFSADVEVFDITAENCRLRWQRPKSDGGTGIRVNASAISSINCNFPTGLHHREARGPHRRMEEDRRSEGMCWHSKAKLVLKINAEKLQAKDLKEHNEYKFRIRAFNSVGIGDPGNSSSMIAKNPYGKRCSLMRRETAKIF